MELERLNYKSAGAVRKNRPERLTRRDDEEILHAMRFLGTDSPEQAARWLAECEQRRGA